jgi:probable H4MPT-linked C1 transfer pathway protein
MSDAAAPRAAVSVIGWDIGGVNTKVVRIEKGVVTAVLGQPYELQRNPAGLTALLRKLAGKAGARDGVVHAVTMTAELSQFFRTKRDGVAFVLDAVEHAFGSHAVYVYAVDGCWLTPADARVRFLEAAASNWSATAHVVARRHPDAVLIDVGTTTTDVVPIVNARVAARGRTDPERLSSGELVYTGALRTPVEAIASRVPLGGKTAAVSAEGFALAGDVHVWRGDLSPDDYTVPAPDGRPPTREFAGERLARVVCADRELLDEAAVSAIASALAAAQIDRIANAAASVAARHPGLQIAVVTGLGAFIAAAAARAAGLQPVFLAGELGDAAARCAPAAAVALLLDEAMHGVDPKAFFETTMQTAGYAAPSGSRRSPLSPGLSPGRADDGLRARGESRVETVVKIGGGLLEHPAHFAIVLETIAAAAREGSLLVVPGGGVFADTVREIDRRIGLTAAGSHWMAVLAMDQYAQLLVERLQGGVLVFNDAEIAAALAGRRAPILAPSRWLRDEDPLPHSWDVTSDSIAAWIAGRVGARRLVLIKPPGAADGQLVDDYFGRALPASVTPSIVAADAIDALRSALRK